MVCLGFDASGKDVVAGVISNFNNYYEVVLRDMSGTENLIRAIEMCLSHENLTIDDVQYMAIGIGPGSWTGSRVAVVTGLGLIAGMKVKPEVFTFDSFDLIAYNELEEEEEEREDAVYLVKAYANYIYAKEQDGEPFFVSKDEFEEKYSIENSYSLDPIFEETKIVDRNLKAVLVHKLANNDVVDIESVEPMYLRASQAELQLNSKNKGR